LIDERQRASSQLKGPKVQDFDGDKKQFIEHLGQALYASKIISYAQGFMLMREAAKQYSWKLNYGSIALMWRGGCIIRRLVAQGSDVLHRLCRLCSQCLSGKHQISLREE
jgi:6-phosphogluconate dehydrogenase